MPSTCRDDFERNRDGCEENFTTRERVCDRLREERVQECERRDVVEERTCVEESTRRAESCNEWHPLLGWTCHLGNAVASTFCVVWETVRTVICHGESWVRNVVCEGERWITRTFCNISNVLQKAVCTFIDVITTIVGFVVGILEETVGIIADFLSKALELVFVIPIIGRALSIGYHLVTAVHHRLIKFPIEVFMAAFGVLPEKKLRVCVLIPSQLADIKTNQPVLPQNSASTIETTNIAALVLQLREAARILRQECNIRLIPSTHPINPLLAPNAFSEEMEPDMNWIAEVDIADAALDVTCEEDWFLNNFWIEGSYTSIFSLSCTKGAFRKLIGYGVPVKVIVVRSHRSGAAGCGMSEFLSDHVTVNASSENSALDVIAHELGHACSLMHENIDLQNLMVPARRRQGQRLSRFQVVIIRSSKFVTYV